MAWIQHAPARADSAIGFVKHQHIRLVHAKFKQNQRYTDHDDEAGGCAEYDLHNP
jgi:hypothetical protein